MKPKTKLGKGEVKVRKPIPKKPSRAMTTKKGAKGYDRTKDKSGVKNEMEDEGS